MSESQRPRRSGPGGSGKRDGGSRSRSGGSRDSAGRGRDFGGSRRRSDGADRRAGRADRRRDGGKRDDAAAEETGPPKPQVPEHIEFSDLDSDARKQLRSLPKDLAERVGRHLVAAGELLHEDPEQALEHARYAKSLASRIAVVREAAGIAAYRAGKWSEALTELRAVRRMTAENIHVAVMADAERALGRPERALDLLKETDPSTVPAAVAIEMKIVAAGARRDLGQLDAAVVGLQVPELDPSRHRPWSARLFYAYADNLLAAGRRDEAVNWFVHAAEHDTDEETDAAERAAELGR